MQTGLLKLHHFLGWCVFLYLVASIIKSFIKWQQKKAFDASDKKTWLFTLILAHTTLLVGLFQVLWGRFGVFTHPVRENIPLMKDKFYRFYWIEHPTGMIVSIILITLGYGMSKKPVADETKFKKAFWYFTIALIIILATVPWPSREIIGRPLIP